jgi:hypothetical protein
LAAVFHFDVRCTRRNLPDAHHVLCWVPVENGFEEDLMRAKPNAIYCLLLAAVFGVSFSMANPTLSLRAALGEFESGATLPTRCPADSAVGTQREISRYQILPVVWREYSKSQNYQDPEAAWLVACKILQDRERSFRDATGRQWDPVDLYVMWNAPGQYRRAKWNRARVSPVVLERAHRFANLLQERLRQSANRP